MEVEEGQAAMLVCEQGWFASKAERRFSQPVANVDAQALIDTAVSAHATSTIRETWHAPQT